MSGGDDSEPEEVATRSSVATTESGGKAFWAMLDNLTCKSRTDPAGWSSDEWAPEHEALTRWRWDPSHGAGSFWAHLALIRLGHSPTQPFFKHVFSKLKTLGRLRGIKKHVFFEKLALPHLERLKPHLNSDELLSMAIHVSMLHCPPAACTDPGTVRGTRVGLPPPRPGQSQHGRPGTDRRGGG